MNVEFLAPQDLIPNPQNPRILQDAIKPVAKSIQEFGFLVPVVINDSNVILSGHARTQAALSLDLEQIPTIRARDLSQEQQNAFMLADNRLSENASYNNSLLADILKDLDSNDYDLSVTGFSTDEINAYLDSATESLDSILGLDFDEPEENPIPETEEIVEDENKDERQMKKLNFLVTQPQREIIEAKLKEIKETVGRRVSNGELLTILCSS